MRYLPHVILLLTLATTPVLTGADKRRESAGADGQVGQEANGLSGADAVQEKQKYLVDIIDLGRRLAQDLLMIPDLDG